MNKYILILFTYCLCFGHNNLRAQENIPNPIIIDSNSLQLLKIDSLAINDNIVENDDEIPIEEEIKVKKKSKRISFKNKKKEEQLVDIDSLKPTLSIRDSVVIKYVYDTIYHIEPANAKMQIVLNYTPEIANNTYVSKADEVVIEEYEEQFFFGEYDIPSQTDEYIKEKIEKYPSTLPLVFNSSVKAQIELFVNDDKNRDWVQDVLPLQDIYFPIYNKYLDQYGIPVEMRYLSVIESGLNPEATSHAGAKGLWQFMPGTAGMMRLRNNSYIDESRDPIKSTEAACKYLTDLYGDFDDWFLAMAAYNCGPGNVRKAIRKSGGKKDFWEIKEHLPRETRNYIPKFIAMVYLFDNYKAHNLKPYTLEPDLLITDTLHIHQNLNLKTYSEYTGASIDHLRFLNPILKKDEIHHPNPTFVLNVPYRSLDGFWNNRSKILTGKNHINATYNSISYGNNGDIIHTVSKGQSLGSIASKYKVSVEDLKNWNNLKSNMIHPNQKLHLYKYDLPMTTYKVPTGKSHKDSHVSTSIMESNFFYHIIQHGDTFESIAEQYEGSNQQAIRLFNNLPPNAYLKPGEQIKIPVKG